MIDKVIWESLKKVDQINSSILDENLIIQLKDLGIITEFEFDELKYLEYKHNLTKYDQTQKSFLIYPTLKCNLNCPYCFEVNKNDSINQNKFETLKLFLFKEVNDHKLKNIHIRWSGGEPLLVWKKIKDINTSIRQLCDKNKIKFESSIATNGVLIDEAMSKEFKDAGITSITISIDGPEEIHNQRRFIKNSNEGTFKKVMQGILFLTKLHKVILRVNIDKSNIEHFQKLLDDLVFYKIPQDKISIYCKPVIPNTLCGIDTTMYDDNDFLKVENKLLETAITNNFSYNFHPGLKASTRCPAYQLNSFIIDPNLLLYRCSKYIGLKEKSVGFIDSEGEKVINDFQTVLKHITLSPFTNKECRKCKILPLCFGKCPIRWEDLNFQKGQGCIPDKKSITRKIEYCLLNETQKDLINYE